MSNQKLTRIPSLLFLRIRGLVGLLLIAGFLGSCTQPETWILYNNTSQSLMVKQFRRDEDVKISDFRPGASLELPSWATNYYQISFGGIIWSYEPPGTGPGFVEMLEYGLFGKPIVTAQLEPDGRIFLLPPGVEPPVQSLPEQPKRYPLIPQISETS